MNGKAVAFDIIPGKSLTAAEVWAELCKIGTRHWRHHKLDHHIKTASAGDDLAGTVLRLRGERQDAVTVKKTLSTQLRTVPAGQELSATTHFLVCRQSLRGLYFSYAGALPFSDFRHWLALTTNAAFQSRRRAARKGAESESPPPAEGFLIDCVPHIRREKLEEVLRAWNAINELEYTASSVSIDRQKAMPLHPNMKRIVHVVKLSADATEGGTRKGGVSALARRILEHVGVLRANKQLDDKYPAKVRGTDENKQSRSIDLDGMLDEFFTEEVSHATYDFKTHDPLQSAIVRRMLTAADEHRAAFRIATG